MVSLNVKSLSTYIPSEKTADIILTNAYQDKKDSTNITKKGYVKRIY